VPLPPLRRDCILPKRVLDNLQRHGILTDFLTLHVSAGTFLPVKVQNAVTHDMHAEQVIISERTLHHLLLPDRPVLAVGTYFPANARKFILVWSKTTQRSDAEFTIQKFDPYAPRLGTPTKRNRFGRSRPDEPEEFEVSYRRNIHLHLTGYPFRVVDGLITNFHQPNLPCCC